MEWLQLRVSASSGTDRLAWEEPKGKLTFLVSSTGSSDRF